MNYYNYFTEIEEHFVRRRGKHLLISPMDWGLIATWREVGIPLHVALRGIDIAMDGFFARQGRATSKVSSLCYCHDSVMAEYARHLESRIGEHPEDEAKADEPASDKGQDPDGKEVSGFISARISEIKSLVAKQYPTETPEGMSRVLERLEELRNALESGTRLDSEALERDFGLVDRLLVEELRASVPPDEAAVWEKEAKRELKVYKKRLPKETYEKIYNNFMSDKIHKKFGIGEFSLFHL
ncbi:MAG TPA: hypothetical protein VMG30_15305 [Acidobacteriota bacterium]|nr:hypothetical protein [Acidobacteriota bacterium]